jgi:ribosomal protein S18 acetylase RimI-like enzyme
VLLREFRFPGDYPAALDLWQHAGPGIHVGPSDTPEEIARKVARDPDLFLVAEEDGRIIGTVIGGFDGRRGMIYHLAVEPTLRGRGLGRMLMDEVEQRLRRKGCFKAYLLVMDGNSAVEFYKNLGWDTMDVTLLAKQLL